MEHIIDAKNRQLGRVATEAATALRGKNEVSFTPNKLPDVKVKIINADQINISEKKLSQKNYKRYSGYPGGLKLEPLGKILHKKGIDFILKKTITGMLPKNKLQDKIIKNLVVIK